MSDIKANLKNILASIQEVVSHEDPHLCVTESFEKLVTELKEAVGFLKIDISRKMAPEPAHLSPGSVYIPAPAPAPEPVVEPVVEPAPAPEPVVKSEPTTPVAEESVPEQAPAEVPAVAEADPAPVKKKGKA